jgi:hypothetical protein
MEYCKKAAVLFPGDPKAEEAEFKIHEEKEEELRRRPAAVPGFIRPI